MQTADAVVTQNERINLLANHLAAASSAPAIGKKSPEDVVIVA